MIVNVQMHPVRSAEFTCGPGAVIVLEIHIVIESGAERSLLLAHCERSLINLLNVLNGDCIKQASLLVAHFPAVVLVY